MILQDKNINNIMTKKRSSLTLILVYLMAGVEGIEPSSGVLETLILPMNYTPKCEQNYGIIPDKKSQ